MPGEKDEYQEIAEKVERGENLSKDEVDIIMSQPMGDVELNPEDMPDNLDDAFKNVDEESAEDIEKQLENKESQASEDDKETDEKKTDTSEGKKDEEGKKKESDTSKDTKKDESMGWNKVEEQLDRPEGSEDLSAFSDVEKGLFYEARRQRKRAQDAESERDVLKFQKIKGDVNPEDKTNETEESDDDDDFVTKGDVKKAVQDAVKSTGKDKGGAEASVDPMVSNYLAMCDVTAKSQHKDYEEVLECSQEIIATNPAAQMEVAKALKDGRNPALVMYSLIKGDPKFETILPIAQARLASVKKDKESTTSTESKKETVKKAEETEKKLADNKKKPTTSAHHTGGEGSGKVISYMDFIGMSDQEFSNRPKAERDQLLKKYG